MSQTPSEKALLVACDGCHSRKIKCDRTNPCGNCKDSNVKCRRERPTLPRKPRRNISEQVTDSIEELKERLSVLEKSMLQLIQNGSSTAQSAYQSPASSSKNSHSTLPIKRSSSTAFGYRDLGHSPADAKYSAPLFSVSEAQIAIENEIQSAPNLSEKRRAVFNAAINSLKHSLDASEGESKFAYGSLELSRDALFSPALPSAELIHLILKPRRGNNEPSSWALDDFLPILSKKTFVRMYKKLYETQDGDYDLPSLLCVSAHAYNFIMDSVMGDTVDPDLEQIMSSQCQAYLTTARAALSQLSLLAAPSLVNLQAICHGAIISQEAGDLGSAWTLTAAGCNMCLQLDLHRKNNDLTSSNTSEDEKFEAYYCLIFCYVNDKGLSMSLGRSSHFKDADFEVDLRLDPKHALKISRFYLDLAIIHSGIVKDLQGNSVHRDPNQTDTVLEELLERLDTIWIDIRTTQAEAEKIPREERRDPDLEWLMVDFTFYSTKATLLTAPALSHECRARYKEASLDAARASLNELRKSRQFANAEHHGIELVRSVAHWTILYFPFTSFFILFCNVARNNYMPDYTAMKDFVTHLSEVRETSPAIAKLHNLCQAFCTLAATLLSTPESASKRLSFSEGATDVESSARKRLKRATKNDGAASVPVNNTFATLNTEPSSNVVHSDSTPMEQTMPDTFNPEVSVPVPDINFEPIPYVDNDSSLWQLLDTQPRLQWLDTDLSAFDHMWGDPMLYQDIVPRY